MVLSFAPLWGWLSGNKMTYKYDPKNWTATSIKISNRVRKWSDEVVEKGSKLFNGGPPCPFARKAWLQSSVMIHVTPDLDAIVDIKAAHPPSGDDTYLFVWVGWEDMSPDDFSDWIYDQNENHFGVWLAAVHPGGENNSLDDSDEDNIFSQVDDMCIILMQEYDHLVAASKALQKTGYYNNYTDAELGVIKDREDKYYAWKHKTNGHYEAKEESETEH